MLAFINNRSCLKYNYKIKTTKATNYFRVLNIDK